MKRRKYKTIYQVEGFPTPDHPRQMICWSSFGLCESKELAEDEIKRLIKDGDMQKPDKKNPQNRAEITEKRIRIK